MMDLTGPEQVEHPGAENFSSARQFGELIDLSLRMNLRFYLFSPDETTSNRLDQVFEHHARLWASPKNSADLPENLNGQIVELLSENTLFALMVGHLMNGEPAIMASYEAFFTVITSQILQYLKFLKQMDETAWRKTAAAERIERELGIYVGDLPACNLLSTSACWRQDHNGFSHQSPMLLSTLLAHPGRKVNCLFPVDDVAATAAYQFMFETKNVVNLVTFDKNPTPRWIDQHHAKFQYEHGASVFGFASDERPDYILTAAGDDVTRESLRALEILRADLPEKRFRFIGINALSFNQVGTVGHPLPQNQFYDYFGLEEPIIANFHGYPDTLKNILARYTDPTRVIAHGFMERGSTTTPFEMLALNHASRYDLAISVAKLESRGDLVHKYREKLRENREHAREFGVDLIEL